MTRLRALAPAATALVLGACADEPTAPGLRADGPPSYETNAIVLESPDHGPMLCLGAIPASYPPLCGTVPLSNWDWGMVDGEESASGTTWGTFHLVGTYDGTTFTVTDAGAEQPPVGTGDEDPIDAGCPEPVGGWVAPDPARASDSDLQATMRAAQGAPDFAGFWIDYVDEPGEGSVPTGGIIVNAAYTGDLERHESELRGVWGGPLCVVGSERTYEELRAIQDELSSEVGTELGLEVLGSGVSQHENVVDVEVVVADEDARLAVEERYGVGAVALHPALTPVDR
jgi:hypothetical protein